jgi:hypothetical protein
MEFVYATACLHSLSEGAAETAREWLRRGWEELLRSPPDAWLVAAAAERDNQRPRRFTASAWASALDLLQDNPLLVYARAADESGSVREVKATRVTDDDQWLRLHAYASHPTPASADEWVDFVAGVLDRADPAYAEISTTNASFTDTELDRALRRDPADSLDQARSYLRGYAWVTVVPRELAQRLSNVDGRRLAGGGLLVRATPMPEEFDRAALARVFRELAPVLPPGTPRPLPGWPLNVVPENAADV